MAPTPRQEIEIVDPETGESAYRDALIHIKCLDCEEIWALELGAGHLTEPCPECSRDGTAQSREPVKLSLTIISETFVDINLSAGDAGGSASKDAETDGIDMYLEHATVWIRRLRHLTSEKDWQLELVEKVNNQTHFHLYRDITPDDGIDYDTLMSWEKAYQAELDKMKQAAD